MFSKNSNNDSVSVSQISAGLEEAIGPTIHKDLDITYMDIDEQQRQNKKRPLPSSTEDEDLIRSSQTPPAKKSTGEKESVSNSGLSHNLQAKSHVTLDTDRLTQASNNQIVSRYGPRDAGPYVVYVYPTARDNALHATLVSRIIVKAGIPDIVEIKKTDRGKIMITVMTATGANRLVENSIFAKHNLKAFIPAFKVLRTGLIQDVPQQFDLDTIKEGLESPRAKILDIQRLNRKITIDNKTEYVPSRTIRIKFAGQILPKEVFLFKVKHEVRPYIPAPRICHRCYRVGHVNNSCKSNPRCKFCGDDSRDRDNDAGCQCNIQTEAPKCINCQGNHWANDRACPIVVKHRSVINTAAVENISIAEARIRIENGWVSSSSPNSPPFETNTRSFVYVCGLSV
ncbi:hypothetical protein ALC62_06312 [Cyphomyrmex costatus]|uniref:CCHC-type domain-containing protein n=1 Tax=Cyphomyrmex costatus TaxID=456900 RepID=A0A151IJ22_9HYME|nr:hypothetical protein ALC62_06312 [Cyphomyrmex costatus]